MAGQKFLRGQVWWVGSKENTGSVQSKNRPCVIVSNDMGNRHAPVLTVVPCTTEEKKDLPTHVKTKVNGVNNTIMCEQIKTVSNLEMLSYMYSFSADTMSEIDEALKIALGLAPIPERVYEETEIEEVHIEEQEEPESDTVTFLTNKKGRVWTIENKVDFINYVESNGIASATVRYDTGMNTKQYYKRFCRALGRKEAI